MSKPFSTNPVLSPGTFGGSPACHILVDMMNKDMITVYQKRKVLAFITSICVEMKAISSIGNSSVREKLMIRSRDYHILRVESMPHPAIFNSLLKNVINHFSKKYLREAARTVAP
jgi:hypothetical protein